MDIVNARLDRRAFFCVQRGGAFRAGFARIRRIRTDGRKNAFPAPPCGAGRAAPLPGHSGNSRRAGGDSTCIAP